MYSCKDSQSLCGFLCQLIIVSLSVRKYFSFMKFHFSIFDLISWTNGVQFRKSIPTSTSYRIQSVFSSNRFSVLSFSYEFLIHVVFCYKIIGMGQVSFIYHVDIQFSQKHLLKTSFLRPCFLYLCQI